jgi:hypothetical protein
MTNDNTVLRKRSYVCLDCEKRPSPVTSATGAMTGLGQKAANVDAKFRTQDNIFINIGNNAKDLIPAPGKNPYMMERGLEQWKQLKFDVV